MKKLLVTILVGSMMLNLSGCTEAKATIAEKERAVNVKKLEESENKVLLDYIGTVDSKDIVNYSFKSTGKLGKVHVEKGDHVRKGDILAELDTTDLNYQLKMAKASLETAELNIKKLKDNLNFQQDLFRKKEKLYETGSISKNEYDRDKLQYDTAQANYDQSKAQYQSAKTSYEQQMSLLEDAIIYAEQDGSIVDTPYEERELIPAGSPVVIIRSKEQIINVGIAQKDLKKVKLGIKAFVNVDSEKASGIITNIDEAPDRETRTYNAEITVNDNSFRLGSIAKVSLDIGKEKGVWIPMTAISTNGVDYVYVISENRALKRTVELVKVHDEKVMVNGIEPGESIVISGMKNLSDGTKVKIVESSDKTEEKIVESSNEMKQKIAK